MLRCCGEVASSLLMVTVLAVWHGEAAHADR